MIAVDDYVLGEASWQAFGSCTFAKARNSRKALGLFMRMVRRADGLWGRGPGAYWVLRFEKGEVAGREHFHFLVGGFPSRQRGGSWMDFFTDSGCLWMVHEWTCLRSGGWARVRPYAELCDSAVEYLLKARENEYERGKFQDLHYSGSFMAYATELRSRVLTV